MEYGYSKVYVTEAEAQELHELIGAAIETGDLSGLPRARQIASAVLRDIQWKDEEE